ITAEDSETGVGKTTAAGDLALTWTPYFTGDEWYVDPHNYGEGMGTVNPKEYFSIIGKVGNEYGPGTVVIVDDAEELDARRSMQNLNVEFSQRWMLMRLKQAITIITLPSPSSIDSRLEELADIWINIKRRGLAIVHDIRVQSYGSRNVLTKKVHKWEFPNVSDHPELQKFERMKENKMDMWDEQPEEEEQPDPEEVSKQEKREIAQRLRNQGMPIESQDPETADIASAIGMSQSWISKNT
ncbi:MAG: ATP-binding protein, partial [Halobacteriaceae archaeon]